LSKFGTLAPSKYCGRRRQVRARLRPRRVCVVMTINRGLHFVTFVLLMLCAVKLSLTSAAKLRQAEAAMNVRGHKKKRKKFQATADMDLASSQQKINLQAGSELCIASLQGVYILVIIILLNHDFCLDISSQMYSLLPFDICCILSVNFYALDMCSFNTLLQCGRLY